MTYIQKRNKAIAASDLIEELQRDPDYLDRTRKAAQHRREHLAQDRITASPVIHDLQEVGFAVESIDALRQSGAQYKNAIPVLLRWLPAISDLGVKSSIVRALSVPWAGADVAHGLLAEFRAVHDGPASGLKWTIGNALEIVADDTVFDEIAELVQDKKHGKSREMLAVALGNMKNPAAADLLIALLSDAEIAGHAIMGLRRLRAAKARSNIEPFLNHPDTWVREEARKALAGISK